MVMAIKSVPVMTVVRWMCTVITVLGVLVKVTMVPIVAFCGGYGPPVLVLLCDYPSLKVHGKLSRLLSSSLSSSSLWKKGLCFLVKSTQRERCGLCLQCWRWSCFLTATLPISRPPRPIGHLRDGQDHYKGYPWQKLDVKHKVTETKHPKVPEAEPIGASHSLSSRSQANPVHDQLRRAVLLYLNICMG